MSFPNEIIIDVWKYLYKRNSKLTLVSTIGAVLLTVFGASTALIRDARKEQELARKRSENLSYNQQLEALNNVQGSLNNLIEFVNLQKTKLKESEDLVNNLKNEQAKLQPVVEADRKTVEALLALQSEKAQHNIWWERGISFALGFGASMLASVIYGIIQFLTNKKKMGPRPPAPA